MELANRPATNGSIATNGRAIDGQPLAHDAERAWQEARGASQIAPFEYLPPMGYREYWYPGLFAKEVGPKKPVFVEIMGEDVVFFRGKADKIYALLDWCPHRSARLSQGESVFPGTITCEYHGYTFDGQGECVAGLIEDPKSPLIGKMNVRSYPTEEYRGVVYIWMGETDPVPLEEDLPPEILDSRNHWFLNRAEWDANWTEPVNQGLDYHEAYLHRKYFNHMGGWRKPLDVQVARPDPEGASFLPAPDCQLRRHQDHLRGRKTLRQQPGESQIRRRVPRRGQRHLAQETVVAVPSHDQAEKSWREGPGQ